jgi:hypothetical protein
MARFNVPPNWPQPPADWQPDPSWWPGEDWPLPPASWSLFVDGEPEPWQQRIQDHFDDLRVERTKRADYADMRTGRVEAAVVAQRVGMDVTGSVVLHHEREMYGDHERRQSVTGVFPDRVERRMFDGRSGQVRIQVIPMAGIRHVDLAQPPGGDGRLHTIDVRMAGTVLTVDTASDMASSGIVLQNIPNEVAATMREAIDDARAAASSRAPSASIALEDVVRALALARDAGILRPSEFNWIRSRLRSLAVADVDQTSPTIDPKDDP